MIFITATDTIQNSTFGYGTVGDIDI
jgi:hypothetical protein